MRKLGAAWSILAGTILTSAGCRQDAGLAPEVDVRVMRGTSVQCLVPDRSQADADPTVVRSRLASVLLAGGDVVCLSEEGGRWRLHSIRDPEIGVTPWAEPARPQSR